MRGNAHVRFGGRVGETDQAERLAPRPDSTLPVTPRRRRAQAGQILVLSAIVMALLFVPLCVFVIDTGLVEAGYAQLGETLQASAEDGASVIDQAAYRSSDGRTVVLDAGGSRAMVDRSMQASRLRGLESWQTTVEGDRVTVSGEVKVHLLVLGPATLTSSRSANFHYGP